MLTHPTERATPFIYPSDSSGAPSAKSPEIRIRGAGVVGSTLALGLSAMGISVVIEQASDTHAPKDEVRAYALNQASWLLLEQLKIGSALPPEAVCAVQDMDVYGDGVGGNLTFSAWQQHTPALARIVDAAALESALKQALQFASHVRITSASPAAADVATMSQGADLLVLCEGRDSVTRQAMGIDWLGHSYDHMAVATRLISDVPHGGVAQQWFRSPDILALLPMHQPEPDKSYGLVWSVPTHQAHQLMQLDDLGFEQALHQALAQSHHASAPIAAGQLKLAGARRAWPLQVGRAQRTSGSGWVMLGDCAHVVHPLAGQGLNLGLADVVELLRTLAQRESWRSLGDARLLARYARARLVSTLAMTSVTDGLWQLFNTHTPWVKTLRNQGMGWMDRADFLKQKCIAWAMN